MLNKIMGFDGQFYCITWTVRLDVPTIAVVQSSTKTPSVITIATNFACAMA